MRYTKSHKTLTHKQILKSAASQIRSQGPEIISIAKLMSANGLTHGGFYAHFSSKDELVHEAISYMFQEKKEFLNGFLSNTSPKEGLSKYISSYLSSEHIYTPEQGCPMALLSMDVSRMSNEAKKAFEKGCKELISIIENELSKINKERTNSLAESIVTEMIGTIALCRALPDSSYSKQILERSKLGILNTINNL